MTSEGVAQHYNAIPNAGIRARMDSKILYLRNFNNWMKSMLIAESLTRLKDEGCRQARVLDLCCGKGGDLLKWRIGEVGEILMTDVADVSIDHAKERYKDVARKMKRQHQEPFKATFLVADAGATRLADHYQPADREFDLASCQFALHYSFADEKRAWQFLKNATERIRPGGYFIGTLPDAYQIVNLIRSKGTNNCYENGVCRIDYTDKSNDLKDIQPPLFGAQIYFVLDQVVNCPEYLAHFGLLTKMLDKLGMDLIYEERFCDAYKRYLKSWDGQQLMQRMKAAETFKLRERFNNEHDKREYRHAAKFLEERFPDKIDESLGTISESEWEVISMYLIFAFKKRGAASDVCVTNQKLSTSMNSPKEAH